MERFKKGLKNGLPIGLGYFSVSFTFGMVATAQGLSTIQATLLSLANLTSAGQFAAIQLMGVNAPVFEVFLTTIIINFRYVLMSVSLSQKLDSKMKLSEKCIVAFGNTDEIYAVAQSQSEPNHFTYMLGLMTTPIIGWTLGTFLGGTFNSLLPASLQSAFSIALYGMFIAIILPVAKKVKTVAFTILISVVLSSLFAYIPFFNFISGGFSIILCTIIASAISASLFPVEVNEYE
jgi:predicted branched-subunit amino acid permease